MGNMGEKPTNKVPIAGLACRASISFSESLMDSSNPDHLVEYIRRKRNLDERPRELFSNIFKSDKPRHSFKLQLKRFHPEKSITDDKQKSQINQSEVEITSERETNKQINSPKKPRLPRVLLHNNLHEIEKHPNARKTLLNEFEMTIKANEFRPPASSTPLTIDDQPTQKGIYSTNSDTNNKHSRKKSNILKSIKPLTSELESANLIECLQNEQSKNKSHINSTSNNQSDNVTLINNDQNSGIENIEQNLLSDQNTLKNQQEENLSPSFIHTSQHQNATFEEFVNLENPVTNINKNQNVKESNNKIISHISATMHSNDKNKSKSVEIPDTEEFVIGTNSESLTIPETQEPAVDIQEVILCESSNRNSENCDKENEVLLPKSPNRRTFTIHKFNNNVFTPPKRQSINNVCETSPKSLRISSPSQMSPLARRAQSNLRYASIKKLPSKIPKFVRTINCLEENVEDAHIQNNQLPQDINDGTISIIIENANGSSPMVVIPIQQTINTSENIPQTNLSSPLPPPFEFCDQTSKVRILRSNQLESPTNHKNNTNGEIKSRASPNITSPPVLTEEVLTEDEGVSSSFNNKKKRNITLHNQGPINLLKNKRISENNKINERIEAIDLNIIPPPVLANEVLTEDEDVSSSFNNKEKRNITLQNQGPINLLKNKRISENNKINERIEAIDLRTIKRPKRKSSIIANNRIDCHYEQIKIKQVKDHASYNRELKRIQKKYDKIPNDLINTDVDLTSENNNVISELLTPRYTPPPSIDDDFLSAEEYPNGIQQESNKNLSEKFYHTPIRPRPSIHIDKENEITFEENVTTKQSNKDKGAIEPHSSSNQMINGLEINSTTFHENNQTNENISLKSNRILRNKLSLCKNKSSTNFDLSKNNNKRNDGKNSVQINKEIIEIQSASAKLPQFTTNKNSSNLEKNIQPIEYTTEEYTTNKNSSNLEKNISKKQSLKDTNSTSGKYNKKKGKSPILSRHITLSKLKANNFNRSNQLEYSEDEIVDVEENHISVTHKSRSRKRIINKRKSAQSSSSSSTLSHKTTTLNIEDTIFSNVDQVGHKETDISEKSDMRNRQRKINKKKAPQLSPTLPENTTNISNGSQDVIIDDPEAMYKFWRHSIANKSKKSNKTAEKNDSLKQSYLNFEKTINLSTRSGRRKLYTKGQSDNSPVASITGISNRNSNNANPESSTKREETDKNKSVINNKQIIEKAHNEFNVDDDVNLNITVEKQNENSISNNSNKKKTKNKKKCHATDINKKKMNGVFKVPTLPAPQSSRKQKNNNVTSNIENKKNNNLNGMESVEPMQTDQDNTHTDSTTQFNTPQKTSTKLVNNIEKYFKNGKRNREIERLKELKTIIIPTEVDNICVETTEIIRRSNRKPCPRVQYWTNERKNFTPETVLIQIKERKKPSYNKKSKMKSNNNKAIDSNLIQKTNELGTITEQTPPELPTNIDHQLSQIFDILKESFTQQEKTSKLTSTSLHKSSISGNNKSSKVRKKSKKNNKIDEPIVEDIEEDINELIITEQLPSTSKTIATANEEGTSTNRGNCESTIRIHSDANEECTSANVNHYDSGNGTDTNDANKGVDPFSWLRKIINSDTTSPKSNTNIIERLKMGKELELASFNYTSTEKDGVEYYFCNSTIQHFGFIKIKPNLVKRASKLKHYNINFILFCGELEFTVAADNLQNIKAGEIVIIKRNVSYSIANKANTDALLLFIKIKE